MRLTEINRTHLSAVLTCSTTCPHMFSFTSLRYVIFTFYVWAYSIALQCVERSNKYMMHYNKFTFYLGV